ncbi:MAG: Gfo/Idh/MocA family oxidoreductase [Bdellovibrionia bacterium]
MKKQPIQYAVVGLGHIAQTAILPAFQNCKGSRLRALVSGDTTKRKLLGRKYRVKQTYSYDEYDECLHSGEIDAVYLALPNHLHKEYTIRAAQAGVHVLCEKPMAVSAADCEEMIRACDDNKVKLMIAYRLHFEAATLKAIEIINTQKKIGDARIFQSIQSMPVNFPNIRTLPVSLGGGPTYDIGIYPINAARYVFQDEPVLISAEPAFSDQPGLQDIEVSMSVTLKFPSERLASFVYSFGTAKADAFRVAGTKGDLILDSAFTYEGGKSLIVTLNGKKNERFFKARDQFASELDYFSRCIRINEAPEPSGLEGLADVRIIEAIYRSAQNHNAVQLAPVKKDKRPTVEQEIARRPAVQPPDVIHAKPPSRKEAA